MIRTIIMLGMLAAFSPLPAQGDKDPGSKVEFRVTRFDPNDGSSPEFRAGASGEPVEFMVPLTHIGGPYEATLRDGGILDLRRGEGEKPEISLPIKEAERKDLLLVFFPTKESFQVMKVNTPLTRIRGGDRYLVNTTENELAIKLGDGDPLMIGSGKSGLLRGPGGEEIVSLPVLISMREGKEWNLVGTENWPCDPRFRRFLFAYISPRSGHLAFHVVSERL